MSKLAPNTTKYVIRANIKATGVVEKPDVIGALFGQTEGLLGADLNLRELQRTGKIGRVEVKIKSEGGNSEGVITIPSSLTSSETALIAATLETIDRIGPCNAVVKLEAVEDVMEDKRKAVIEKAKAIMKNIIEANAPDTDEISEQIKESVRSEEITIYEGLPAGPGIKDSDSIVVVEGRADVINLLKFGIRNTIGVEGTSVPKSVADLCKEKECTVLTDGDRGGLLIVKEMMQATDVDFIARAPEGKEVEELTKKEVFKAIRDKVPIDQFKKDLAFIEKRLPEKFHRNTSPDQYNETPSSAVTGAFQTKTDYTSQHFVSDDRRAPRGFRGRNLRSPRMREPIVERSDSPPRPSSFTKTVNMKPEQKKSYLKTLEELIGTRAACIFDHDSNLLGRVPAKELSNTIKTIENIHTIVFDGKVDAELEYNARRKGVKVVIAMEKDPSVYSSMTILTKQDLEA